MPHGTPPLPNGRCRIEFESSPDEGTPLPSRSADIPHAPGQLRDGAYTGVPSAGSVVGARWCDIMFGQANAHRLWQGPCVTARSIWMHSAPTSRNDKAEEWR